MGFWDPIPEHGCGFRHAFPLQNCGKIVVRPKSEHSQNFKKIRTLILEHFFKRYIPFPKCLSQKWFKNWGTSPYDSTMTTLIPGPWTSCPLSCPWCKGVYTGRPVTSACFLTSRAAAKSRALLLLAQSPAESWQDQSVHVLTAPCQQLKLQALVLHHMRSGRGWLWTGVPKSTTDEFRQENWLPVNMCKALHLMLSCFLKTSNGLPFSTMFATTCNALLKLRQKDKTMKSQAIKIPNENLEN